MTSDFETFLNACKEWPTSELVAEEMGRMWPTILLQTSLRQVWREFWHAHGYSTQSEIRKGVAGLLSTFEPSAFAVILPLETDELIKLERAVGGSIDAGDGDGPRAWTEYYAEAVLIQAYTLDGDECLLLGLAEGEMESYIDCWVSLATVPGLVARAVEEAVISWRGLPRATACS